MERRRRSEDDPGLDHREQRTLDWRSAAPKWLILVWGTLGWAIGGFGAQLAWNQYQWRIEEVERRASDPWKERLAQLAYEVGMFKVRQEQQEGRVQALESADSRQQLLRLTYEVQRLNERLKMKGF